MNQICRQCRNKKVAWQFSAVSEQVRGLSSSTESRFKNEGHNLRSSVQPSTVRNNLKFKVHDGIESKFLNFYPDLIHILSKQQVPPNNPLHASRVTKLLANCLSTSIIGKRYGLLVPRSYRELGRTEKEEEAIVLGWAVELVRAANNLSAEIIHDHSKNRRGQPTWHRKSELGTTALSHVKILESCLFQLLKKYFENSSCYRYIISSFVESLRHSAIGYSLDLKLNPDDRKPLLQGYDMPRYKSLVYSTKTHPCLVLPVSLALDLADLSQTAVHNQSTKILTEIGLLHQIRQDFENCFKHSEDGDIARGRVTWLIVLAKQRASVSQKEELDNLYGDTCPQSIARVKEIYYKLKLHKNIPIYLEHKTKDIMDSIQQMAKLDNVGLSQSLFFKIHGDICSDDFTFIQTPGHYSSI